MKEEAIFATVCQAINAHFGVPTDRITRDTVAADIAGWDSVNHAVLLMELEGLLGTELPVTELFDVTNVGELCAGIMRVTP